MTPDIQELILTNEQGEIFEGLVSNFACVYTINNTIYLKTAPFSDGAVLSGTIMQLIISNLAEKYGFVVVLNFPMIDDIINCDCAFITSMFW